MTGRIEGQPEEKKARGEEGRRRASHEQPNVFISPGSGTAFKKCVAL